MIPTRSLPRLAAALLVSATIAKAQCGFDWQPGPAAPGPFGTTNVILPLANGEIVAGGNFVVADQSIANNIAQWNGTEWGPLGAGFAQSALLLTPVVNDLVQLPNGDIIAAGGFDSAGEQPANNVARWDGARWSRLGSGVVGEVRVLQPLANGDLLAARLATTNSVQLWNGSTWSTLGLPPIGSVAALAVLPNGDVLAGGDFGALTPLHRWNGATWSQITTVGVAGSVVRDMVTLPSGNVLCAGSFNLPSGIANAALFDGTNFQPLTPPIQGISSLLLRSNGTALALATAISGLQVPVASWNGTSWAQLADAPPRTRQLRESANGELLAVCSQPSNTVQRFDGVQWRPLGAPVPPTIKSMATANDGSVYIGGTFASFEGVAADNIVRWDGDAYSALGLGADGEVRDIAAAPDGSILVGGSFASVGGTPAQGIARWDGQNWTNVGAPPPVFDVYAVCQAPNGDVYVGAEVFSPIVGLWRFDGTSWTQIPLPGIVQNLQDLAVLPTGDVALSGAFVQVPGSTLLTGLLQLSNAAVTPFPGSVAAGIQISTGVQVARNGDLIVSGPSAQRWNGSTWTEIGRLVNLIELPNGDLVGSSQQTFEPIVRVSGTIITPLAAAQGNPSHFAVAGDGDLLVGGPTLTINNRVSVGLARAEARCPASTSTIGTGCVGSAGLVTLQSSSGPWIGSEYQATVTGLPAQSLALDALGSAAPVVPLPQPLGAPGCQLLLTPILTTVLPTAQGTAALSLKLPKDPILAGQSIRQQVLGIEFDQNGITQLTSSNALDLTIGAL
ncbi:MAG: hypothetical protein AB8H80_01650 [Planctomycetota bacterium]